MMPITRSRSVFLCVFVWSLFLGVASCGTLDEATIGSRLYAPFDVARLNRTGDFLFLSSSFDGAYKDGNLVRARLDERGVPNKVQVMKIPRLGTRLALNDDESLLAIGISDLSPQVRVHRVSDAGVDEEVLALYSLSEPRSITGLRWFTVAGDGAEGVPSTFLAVELNGGTNVARVQVFSFDGVKLEPAFLLPDDLPDARTPIFQLGHSSPVFIPELKLLVVLPTGGSGLEQPLMSPYEAVVQQQWTGERDFRSVSLIGVDMERYLSQNNLERSVFFAPIVYNSDGNGVSLNAEKAPDEPADSEKYKRLAFRTSFSAAERLEQGACAPAGEGDVTILAAQSRDQGHVVAVRGFGALRDAYRAVADTARSPSELFFSQQLTFAPFDSGKGSRVVPDRPALVTQIGVQKIGDTCASVVVRAEVITSLDVQTNAGREKVWVTRSTGSDPINPSFLELSQRAAIRYAGVDNLLYFVSFSRNSISTVKSDEPGLSAGPIFTERE
jgi:hypothetical protein